MSDEEKRYDASTGRPLVGCVDAETAFVQEDYPYGRRLRCQRRVWIETKPRYGMRFVSQTSNPKARSSTIQWNTPHGGTYDELIALWVDGKGFVATDHCNGWKDLAEMKAWGERNQALLQGDEWVRNQYTALLLAKEHYEARRAAGEIKLTVTKGEYIPGQGMGAYTTEVITL
jgi:hypothetical protein